MIRALRIAFVAGTILLMWHILVVVTGLPTFILPSPMRVATALFGNMELISQHAMVTMAEVLIGLCLGTILGVITAISLAQSQLARLVLRPAVGFEDGPHLPQARDRVLDLPLEILRTCARV